MRRIVTLFLLCSSAVVTFSQEFLTSEFLKSRDKQYFFNQVGIQVPYEIDLYRISYTTKDVHGVQDTASGLVCIPHNASLSYPLLCYMHGTVGSRYEVPSFGSYEEILPSIYSAFGFIAFTPDYLGLGINKGIHPYLYADGTAEDGKNMMKAVEEFIHSLGRDNSREVFLSGYSQGGHASMALHRLLEATEPDYRVAAAAHMSGPYSISTAMKSLITSNAQYELVAYVVNITLGLNEAYNIIPNNDLNQFFKAEFVEPIEDYKNEVIDLWTLNIKLKDILIQNYGGSYPKKLIKDEILDRIVNDENDIINLALKANDVYNWRPNAPTKLLYCKADDQVSYLNSIIAQDTMRKNGAPNVYAVDVNTSSNHTQCVNPAITNSLFHFIAFQQVTTSLSSETQQPLVVVFPNPVDDMLYIASKYELDAAEFMIFDQKGNMVLKGSLMQSAIDVQELPQGIYALTIVDKKLFTQTLRFAKL